MLLMSLQQPWHPAWSRQWIPQSTNAKWCWSRPLQTNKQTEKGTQTNGNDKMWPPADTKHEDRRDVIYLSSARRRCKCYLPQPKAVTSAMRLIAPRDKKKDWQKPNGWKWMDGATATGATTQGGGNTLFFRSGEEDKRTGCSQDKGGRIQSIAHSQPAKSGKERGWIMSASLGC